MTDRDKRWCKPLCLLFSSIALLLMAASGNVLARQEGPPISWERNVKSLSDLPVLDLPVVSRAALMAEDESTFRPGPLEFAKPVSVSVAPPGSAKASDEATADAAQWERLGDGSRLWRQRVWCPGATDLNMGFSRYNLPKGATLHVYSELEDYYEGPYDHRDNEEHGQLWVPVVPGDQAVVELYVPGSVQEEPALELSQVGCGYRGVFFPSDDDEDHAVPKQGSCNNDVICPEGDPWRDEIRSVARYTVNGSGLCTGTMIKDVPGSFTPFFLSAAHCGVNSGNAASVVVYWNFESPICGDLSGGDLSDNQSGSIFRASRTDVDMLLLELDDDPGLSSNVHFAGWDRTGIAPLGAVGIHHPNGDEKAISFNEDPLITVSSCIGTGGSNTHWEVDNWEDGTTEPGSSGSGIWDPSSRLVGFLSGGAASCANPDASDCYGKFSVAWDSGASPSSRLRDWLDPNNEGAQTVDGEDPQGTIRLSSFNLGADVCPTGAGDNNGFYEPGEITEIIVNLEATDSFTDVEGTLTSLTPGVTVLGGLADWPDLSTGDVEPSTGLLRIAFDETGLACPSAFELELSAVADGPNGSETFVFGLDGPVGGDTGPDDVPLNIQDATSTGSTTVTSTLDIAADVVLTDVNVDVSLDHSYVGDLILTLSGPDGTAVELLALPSCGEDDMRVTFDDDASFTDLQNHCAGDSPWYEGAAVPLDALSAFNGKPSAGTWTLTISDNFTGDVGVLNSWSLATTPSTAATFCEVCVAETLVTVPDVTGQTQTNAEQAITNADLDVGNVTQQNDDTIPAGDVISQDPSAGTQVAAGSLIDLVVSLGPAVVTVSVPNVVGESQVDAQQTLLAADLTVGLVTQQNDATVPAGNVISQNPIGGTEVEIESSVDLVVSLGPAIVTVSVPDVTGQPQAGAEQALLDVGLTVGTVTEIDDDAVPAGDVIDQDPAAGSVVDEGSSVNLLVSSGPGAISVPDVVGETQAQAQSILDATGFVFAINTEQAFSNSVASGLVISQDPSAGTLIPVTEPAINLLVSLGASVTVPDVVNTTQVDAQSALTSVGLNVGNVSEQADDTVPAGNVISQDPVAGSEVAAGTLVDLVVSTGVQTVTVPDVVNQAEAQAQSAIEAAGLVVGNSTTEPSATVAQGDVISQDPAAGEEAPTGSAVNLVVSSGPPNVGGGQGCTHTYWRNPANEGDYCASYAPDTPFFTVFDNAFGTKTLLDVLNQNGAGLNALGRQSAAALLNACSSDVSFDLSEQDVISAFNDVFPGTKSQYVALKNTLKALNAQECPLPVDPGGPELTLVKTGDAGPVGEGDQVNYTLSATNTGGVELTGVTLSDPMLLDLTCNPQSPATLAVNEVMACVGSYTVTAADVAQGSDIVNTATADSAQTSQVSDSHSVAVEDVVNPVPVAVDDDFDIVEGEVLSANVLDNDVPVSAGDVLTVAAVNGSAGNVGSTLNLPTGATVVVNVNGDFVYTPGGVGEDMVRYTLQDDEGRNAVAFLNVTVTAEPGEGTRVTQDLLLLYDFAAGSGDTVFDQSGVVPEIDLVIDDVDAVTWGADGTLSVDNPTSLKSVDPADKLNTRLPIQGALTLEAWIEPAREIGTERIVSVSENLARRNVTLEQGGSGSTAGSRYDVRLRTTVTGNNGSKPFIRTPKNVASAGVLQHVVYTRDIDGAARIYVDGVLQSSRTIAGQMLGAWDATFGLVLANEMTGQRPWLGRFYLVAIYERAITQAEVTQNFEAGPDAESVAEE